MFSVVKVRDGLDRDNYKDPGWYQHPEHTVAYEWQAKSADTDIGPDPTARVEGGDIELGVVKPGGTAHRH